MKSMNDIYDSYTFRLFKKKKVSPFIEGMAAIIDPSISTQYNFDATDTEADFNAIRADWLQVGKDLREAMREYAAGKRKTRVA